MQRGSSKGQVISTSIVYEALPRARDDLAPQCNTVIVHSLEQLARLLLLPSICIPPAQSPAALFITLLVTGRAMAGGTVAKIDLHVITY